MAQTKSKTPRTSTTKTARIKKGGSTAGRVFPRDPGAAARRAARKQAAKKR